MAAEGQDGQLPANREKPDGEPHDSAPGGRPAAPARLNRWRLQFGLGALLVLQAVLCVVLSLLQWLGGVAAPVVLLPIAVGVLVAACFATLTAGMASDPDRLEILTSVSTDMEGALIVDVLQEHGISAKAVGGFTSGFAAEAPGEVRVLVRYADRTRAKEALEGIEFEIDWSMAGFDDGQPPTAEDEPDSEPHDSAAVGHAATSPRLNPRRLQFSLGALVAAQALLSLAFSLLMWQEGALILLVSWPGGPLILLLLLPVGFAVMMVVCWVVGTGGIADRARRVLKYCGGVLVLALIILTSAGLIQKIVQAVLRNF